MTAAPAVPLVVTVIAGKDASLAQHETQAFATLLNARSIQWLAGGKAADLSCMGVVEDIYQTLRGALGDRPLDVLVQPAAARRKKLLLADMESTVIEQEMLDELADKIGLRAEVAAITRRAMNGEIDFRAALIERVILFKDRPASLLEDAAKDITLSPGAAQLVATMRAVGAETWLVTGGFASFAKPVAEMLGFDRFYANDLIMRDGKLTGELAEPLFDRNAKLATLRRAEESGLAVKDMLAVGDGANDVPMLEACNAGGGLGLAYHAKPNVRAAIPHQINHGDLTALLYAQGYRQDEITSSSQT